MVIISKVALFIQANWQTIGIALVAILGGLHSILVLLENVWPEAAKADSVVTKAIMFLDRWVHGSGAWDAPK